MTADPVELVADIARAADECGYGIGRLQPGRIDLIANSQHHLEVTIRSIFLDGDLIRKVLTPLPPTDEEDR